MGGPRGCGCEDWHVSRRAMLGRAAAHVIEIPEQALTDGPAAAAGMLAGRGVTRKRIQGVGEPGSAATREGSST